MTNLAELFKIGNEENLEIQEGVLGQLFHDLSEGEVLHQLFWMELENIDGCQLVAYNGYCMSDLFLSHKTLSIDYELFREENVQTGLAPKKYVGGRLYAYGKRDWVNVDYELSEELAENLVCSFNGPAEIREVVRSLSETYFLVKTLIYMNPEQYESEYGVKLLSYNSGETLDAYSEYVDRDEFDASADFVHVKAKYSWRVLPLGKKIIILDCLLKAFRTLDFEPSKDAEHFLACMALHPDTPSEFLETLASLGSDLVSSTLARRATAS